MPIVVFANEKGGVGKTSMAVHYCVYRHEEGDRVVVFDLSSQRHTERRLAACLYDVPVRYLPAARLAARIKRHAAKHLPPNAALPIRSGADLVVIDTPGDLDQAKPAFMVADLVVLPCLPSDEDLDSTCRTLARIAEVRRVRRGLPMALVFLNRATSRRRATAHAREITRALEGRGVPVCRGAMPDRAAIASASRAQTVAWRVSDGAETTKRMQELFVEIDSYVNKANAIRERLEQAASSRGARGRRETSAA